MKTTTSRGTDGERADEPAAAARGRGRPKPPCDLELRVTVTEIEPPIWRLVRVPDDYTLHQLHRVFQLLFGWLDYHLYDFRIGERRFEAPDPEAEAEPSTKARLRDFGFEAGDRFTYCTTGATTGSTRSWWRSCTSRSFGAASRGSPS
jgi:hypothetical protein